MAACDWFLNRKVVVNGQEAMGKFSLTVTVTGRNIS